MFYVDSAAKCTGQLEAHLNLQICIIHFIISLLYFCTPRQPPPSSLIVADIISAKAALQYLLQGRALLFLAFPLTGRIPPQGEETLDKQPPNRDKWLP